ncbi:arsenical pump-driving ATPase [Pengzhenrongella sicca]|uniref:Arsenical pump-driving ATPase n=1 Tax=Pengzhenrongella sicca TaxID=2819238 RepID=A0A8A4Z9W1_9MICO|nr:arsenical pump-driving ATPase [Pengzhenrongella sicca]QTE28211.1 arsenical pump-driving ATPase [Pengzhenrongella sicca]
MTSAPESTGTVARPEILTAVLANPTRYLFFTGKGGVGKTSCAAATAIALADAGRRVLIVSTDPASNLAEVFAMGDVTGSAPVAVPGVVSLAVVNIDPAAAAAHYRERVVGPYRGVLPADAVASIEEELSGSCTVEVAAFNEFVTLLTDPAVAATYDHVVFDTAPTGHTLRLLALPAAWTGFLATNTAGVTCVGPVSALGQAQESYAGALATLRDPAVTTMILVTRPEASALAEAARAAHELRTLAMTQQRLIVNGVLAAGTSADVVALARAGREADALAALAPELAHVLSVDTVPLLARAPLGVAGLRAALAPAPPDAPLGAPLAAVTGAPGAATTAPATTGRDVPGVALRDVVDAVAAAGPGLVLTMGKGGVGKTTVAAAIALALADRGLPVSLTTTDPAAHVDDVLPDPPANLTITRIDPVAETARHTAHVLATAGSHLDAAARDLLAEDLRSPCTEEVAVFHAFARTIADAAGRYVVIDTAPTGHTLLLLQSSAAFARQGQSGADAPAATLFGSLSDPEHTRILLVALAEATPVHEAQALQADLARAGLAPFTWVVDSSLAATATTHPVLRARADQESRWLAEIAASSPRPPAVIGWLPEVPTGAAGLRQLTAPPTAAPATTARG